MALETITVGHAYHKITGEHAVIIKCFTGDHLDYASAVTPTVAREIASDLMKFADSVDTELDQARKNATAAISKAKRG